MEPVYNYKDLHDSVINLGEMAAKASEEEVRKEKKE